MTKIFNRARMTTSTTGTGTITLGSAVTGFATFAEAGVSDSDEVAYVIEEGNDFEIGIGTYTASGTTLSRDTVRLSKISGSAGTSKMNLGGNAEVFISPLAEELPGYTNGALADGAVTTAKIADGDVTFTKLAAAAIVTEAEGISSNDNDTTIPTSAAVLDHVANNAGGLSWNDVTSSRSFDTVYTNNNGKSLIVGVQASVTSANESALEINVDGIQVTPNTAFVESGSGNIALLIFVPDGSTYEITTSGAGTWTLDLVEELR